MIVSFKLKLKFDGKQNISFVFADYLLSQFQNSLDCLIEVEFETFDVFEYIFEDNLQCLQTSFDFTDA
jgi:hypothetical protein